MITNSGCVLCGTDFSTHAGEAAEVAAAIARKLNVPVALAHVVDNLGLGPGDPSLLELLLARKRERLHAEAERLRALGTVVREEFHTGSPHAALIEAAGRLNAGLIVVSSVGWISPSRVLIGSVAERIAETSPVPTLVVRSAAPFAAWARGEQPLKVLVGYDFSASADAALRWVGALNQIGPCEITVAHVNWPPGEIRRLGIGGPLSLTDNPDEVQRVLERDMQDRVAPLLGQQRAGLRVQPGWGRADSHLLELAHTTRADLLVTGTHQRHGISRLWLGSVSRGILHHAPMSVAVAPAPKTTEPATALIPEIRRVLAPTDFSELGNRSIPLACAVLPRAGRVCLLHVAEPGRRPAGLEAQLRALIPAGAAARGIETHVEIVESLDHATAICQAAERLGADLICMGSHGRTGLSQALLGSVAQAVMTDSRRPVLIVRPPAS